MIILPSRKIFKPILAAVIFLTTESRVVFVCSFIPLISRKYSPGLMPAFSAGDGKTEGFRR